LGARADATLVRHGAESARVEALFDRLPEPLIAVREVGANGRSTARVDDDAVTAGRLALATEGLVEIHGQHDQQRLLDEDWQRDLLDAFGGHEAPRAAVAAAVERWRANKAALAELAMEPRELLRRLEILEHEASEIGAGRLQAGEAAEITASWPSCSTARRSWPGRRRPGDAPRRGRGAGAGGEGRQEPGRWPARPRWGPLADRLAGLEAELEDVAAEARTLAEGVDHDPASLARSRSAGRDPPAAAAVRRRRGDRDRPRADRRRRRSGCAGSRTSGPPRR
jgi:DNA repair protein RecN (Recombination protein N)